MKETRAIMGMPVSVEITSASGSKDSLEKAFEYFYYVDRTFSTYKSDSEVSRINRGELQQKDFSSDMKVIARLAEETKQLTNGYFDIKTPSGAIDPSGIVKGWAINNVAELLRSLGHADFYAEAGGDIQTRGKNSEGNHWRIGIRDPFDHEKIVKVVYLKDCGIATSGTAVRGNHIYDPHSKRPVKTDLVSLTVIGPNVYEADRFATAAFAMGDRGVDFIERLEGFEAYAIDTKRTATMTSGFRNYTYDQDD